MEPLLSIMIASLPERKDKLARLLAILEPQITDESELLVFVSNKAETLGQKRDRMIRAAVGRFVCFVDDDDIVADDYVSLVTEAIKNNPDIDCVGFAGTLECPNGTVYKERYTIQNRDRMGRFNNVYECFVGHITPIRRDIVLSVGFKSVDFGEDSEFCKQIMPLCQKEAYIDKVMYRYIVRLNF